MSKRLPQVKHQDGRRGRVEEVEDRARDRERSLHRYEDGRAHPFDDAAPQVTSGRRLDLLGSACFDSV